MRGPLSRWRAARTALWSAGEAAAGGERVSDRREASGRCSAFRRGRVRERLPAEEGATPCLAPKRSSFPPPPTPSAERSPLSRHTLPCPLY